MHPHLTAVLAAMAFARSLPHPRPPGLVLTIDTDRLPDSAPNTRRVIASEALVRLIADRIVRELARRIAATDSRATVPAAWIARAAIAQDAMAAALWAEIVTDSAGEQTFVETLLCHLRELGLRVADNRFAHVLTTPNPDVRWVSDDGNLANLAPGATVPDSQAA